jgi:hypothetical protein
MRQLTVRPAQRRRPELPAVRARQDEFTRLTPASEIGVEGAAVRTVVVTAREDVEMGRQVRAWPN